MDITRYEVPPEKLRWRCDPAIFDFDCTRELAPIGEFIGQDRAMRAIEFGLFMGLDGYNIYVAGLTGKQGETIPRLNLPNLMLRQKVMDAVKQGKFHIYAVVTIDEGIEVLTGVNAGQKKDGKYPEGAVNYLVDKNLGEMAARLRHFYTTEKEKNEKEQQ